LIEIDGSYGSGGGQVIRTAVALSAVTGKSVNIKNIRIKRDKPGLRAQHATGVKAVAKICDAETEGVEIGSSEIVFKPGKIKNGKFNFDIGTAGSITLVLQTLVIVAAHAQEEMIFKIKGGTNVNWSPPIEYFQQVFCDYMKKIGYDIKMDVERYGFYPKGGGVVTVKTTPWKEIKKLNLLERGELSKVDIHSVASKDLEKAEVAKRQARSLRKNLLNAIPDLKIEIVQKEYVDSFSTGSSIHAHAHYDNCRLGAESLGERGKSSETVGKECAERLLFEMNSKATVDSHMADQIIPFLAFSGGEFLTSRVSEHLKTNIWVVEKFIGNKFKIADLKISTI
jgi:RNA 3'-phosphate cyclase